MELSRESFREEVIQFRSTFKEDALDLASRSLTLEKKGNVGWLLFDAPNTKANTLSTPVMLHLFELLLEVETDKEIGALVLFSKKPSIFIAGADIAEIQRLNREGNAAQSLMKLQAVFTYLENLKVPSIAAIHGATLGGGLELALSCDYRMVSDARETRLGLPEVQLGVLPGWGGTQRLPRLVGLAKALEMILTGKQLDAKAAKKIGLANKVVPKEWLESKASAWAEELAKTKKKADKHADLDLKEKALETIPGGKWLIFDQAKKNVLAKTKGNYPAPLKALEVIHKTYDGDLLKGLRVEAEAFAELVKTPESRNLIDVFYLTDRVKKDRGTKNAVEAKAVQQGGVIGAGVMGGGIARLFAAKDVRVRMKDIHWDAITKGYQAAYKIFKKQVDRRKMKPNALANAMALIEGTTSWQGFKNSDLIVEAVVEDLEVKKKVFQELEAACGEKTILATNTSSLSVTTIGSACKDPSRVVGMHFFNPVDKMPLVEVIRGKQSSDLAVATVYQFAKRLGKTPIVVADSPGFVVNRILGPYLNEAIFLLLEGASVTEMDKAMESFGMPMGPCELLDEVGLDVASKVSKVLFGAFGERMKPPQVMEIIVSEKRLGKKVGKGIYVYEKGHSKGAPDPSLLSKIGVKTGKPIKSDQIIKRLTYLMVNEAARCLEESVVTDPAIIDIGMIFGTGFAPFRGGLLRYADSVGPEAIVADLDLFTRSLGMRYEPCNYLQQLAVGNKKFYEP